MFKYLLAFAISATVLFAQKGDVSIFILKDGKPLANIEILIDETNKLSTDKDGFAFATLNSGPHQALIDVKENGQMIAFARHNFIIAPGKNTEVILTLTESGKVANIDDEASSETTKYKDYNASTDEKKIVLVTMTGSIVSTEGDVAVANARIFVKGVSTSAQTDAQGKFTLELPAGEQTLSILHNKFTAQTLKITLQEGKTLHKEIKLRPAGIELEEFIVLKPKVAGSVASVLEEKRNDTSVSEVLGSEQMSKAGDSKASDALTRVTGVTLVDGKYVFVRGLGDRYTAISLNSFFLPSPNPLKRTVPLDIFPTGVLESIKVQKSATADKSAEFAGGLVELRTKNVPDEFFMKMGVSLSYDESATFKTVGSYAGGSTDYLGYDDGGRALTDEINAATNSGSPIQLGIPGLKDGLTSTEITALTNSLSNNNNVIDKLFLPGMNFNFSMGDSYKFINGAKLGYFSSLSYKYENDYTNYEKQGYYTTNSGELLASPDSSDFNVSKESASLSGMVGMGVEFSKKSKINWTNLYLHKGSKVVRDAITTTANGQKHEVDLSWTEESLISSQIIGEHTLSFLGDLKIDWRGAFTSAQLDEPDRISYTFEYDDIAGTYSYDPANNDIYQRQFNTLDDTNLEAGLDLTLPVSWWTKEKAKFKMGGMMLSKSRQSRSRTFLYKQQASSKIAEGEIDNVVNEANIGTTGDDFIITELDSDVGAYDATQFLLGAYGMMDIPLSDSLKINAGLRFEISSQELKVLNSVTLDEFADGYALNETADLFPSILLTYKLNKDMQIRTGYARTTSRPDFKELSSALVVDTASGDIYQGNPDLQSALIDNFDLRFEWYMSKTETFSFAVFSKLFSNPIEKVMKPTSDGELFSYDNAVSASNQGFEIDVRKKLNTIYGYDLSDYYIAANYSFISSQIDVTGNTINEGGILTTAVRPMQGQSPYVYNVRFGYDSEDTGLSATVLFNVFGERISKVGIQGLPDYYEQPVERLDFVTQYQINEALKFSFKATNLLNPDYVTVQGSEIYYSYNKGRKYTMGLSYKY